MDENRVSASISVDIRKHRIRIHKATLNQLGPPKYIQLLVNPDNRIVAVRGLDKKCRESHVVNLTRIRPDNSYELYSKQLVLTLMTLLPELDGECTYRLTGEVYTSKKIAFFPLDTIQRVEGGV